MKKIWVEFKQRPWWRKVIDILLVLFALAGAAIIGAWGLYQLGVTNNRGAVDKNYRYLMSVSEMEGIDTNVATQEQIDAQWAEQYGRLAVLARFYPENARLIMRAAATSDDPLAVERMVRAAGVYFPDNDTLASMQHHVTNALNRAPQQQNGNIIPWMRGAEWPPLKEAILRDSALIIEAGRLTGVEPRLIVGCLIGEQIRLFNSKREMFKKYLGPVKVLSVESQFSYGVNGIKDFTAQAVEEHLKDPTSEFYMGPAYEHLLDFATNDPETERYNRLVDYQNHLYSYIYTGCILHQTMLQWRRAGYDISNRPELLITLFNLGFNKSVPHADAMPGGSTIEVGDNKYTFGAIGFDFYYSGELADAFPLHRQLFTSTGQALTADDVERIQQNMSDCNRPERGLEYRRDSTPGQPATYVEPPDPFGIDHSKVVPMDHTVQ
ncbi:MAG: hypothetical protein IKM79_00195 [Bacteroidales bacterium]|nr:hypothetical protein [Bacteroidales bacterium]